MTISVLMSVYHKEKASNLDAALASVWTEQTRRPEQIILIEDGPLGDDLECVIGKWKKLLGEKLTIHKNQENIGLTKSLNIGIGLTTSDLIARMDSDDISDRKRFELQEAYLVAHPDIDIIGGSLQEFNQDHASLSVRHYPLCPEDAIKIIYKASPLAHPTVMMRKRIFKNGMKYDERYRTSQDIALWFDALRDGYKISNIPEVTLYFRRDDFLFHRRSREKAWDEFRIYMKGIYALNGLFTGKYIFPVMRLAFRLMPQALIKRIYGSNLRSKVTNDTTASPHKNS